MSQSLPSAPDPDNTDQIANVANCDSLEGRKAHWEIKHISGTNRYQICMPSSVGCLSYLIEGAIYQDKLQTESSDKVLAE